jgi:hypothetical protein
MRTKSNTVYRLFSMSQTMIQISQAIKTKTHLTILSITMAIAFWLDMFFFWIMMTEKHP